MVTAAIASGDPIALAAAAPWAAVLVDATDAGRRPALTRALRAATEKLVVGHALEAGTQIGPVVDGVQLESVERERLAGRDDGGGEVLLVGGVRGEVTVERRARHQAPVEGNGIDRQPVPAARAAAAAAC
mgnify:CR=1 FL=1